ncbi:MAG: tRNA-dependent cyclodipeptide synthase [Humidesulfovibrio sp.]|nr:tRNA-dependent cyclodipeptide synthase [Humidesulfovibrio sp.]
MRYEDLFNTTQEEIEARRWNPYLGISVRNRYFTPEALTEYARWGAVHAKDRFALLVVDIIQRVNNEVLDRVPAAKAFERALKQSDPIRERCALAVAALPPDLRAKVVVIEWADIIDETYTWNRELVFSHFEADPEFRDFITSSVANSLGSIVGRLKGGDIETLSQYLLFEIPELFCGFMHQGVHYNLCAYPGGLGFLMQELAQRACFQPVLSKLRTLGPVAHAEMYVDA